MLQLQHLQDHHGARVRGFMTEEVLLDQQENRLYLSPRLSSKGRGEYISLLTGAISRGDDSELAYVLRNGGCIAETEVSHRKGKQYTKKVPVNAHETLAEGEFNRFYLRALCRIAIEEGMSIEVCRARVSTNPRPESEELIGREFDPQQLLQDLRSNIGIDTVLGLPPGPNSGLSGRLKIRS
ncbi:MAG: hypothetical protein KY459_11950 [Acidobacteria bacterium]|nr:hypothetical protein [Acidobacteriota bacterium]